VYWLKTTILPKATFDTLHGHESRPHCHDTVLRYAVKLQVCTHTISATSCLSCRYQLVPFSYRYHCIAHLQPTLSGLPNATRECRKVADPSSMSVEEEAEYTYCVKPLPFGSETVPLGMEIRGLYLAELHLVMCFPGEGSAWNANGCVPHHHFTAGSSSSFCMVLFCIEDVRCLLFLFQR